MRFRTPFLVTAAIMMTASFIAVGVWGLKFGLDFTGGSLMEARFTASEQAQTMPTIEQVSAAMHPLGLGDARLQPSGDGKLIIRTRTLSEGEHGAVLAALSTTGQWQEERFTSVGPTIGNELRQRSIIAIAITVLAILSYIAFAFRGIGKDVPSWKYGVVAIVALVHDIILPTGLFALLGYYYGVEVDALFITALLTILGFSIHDTIVVFDRVRENLLRYPARAFRENVNASMRETLARSINTSLTTLIVLVAIILLGGDTVRYFALALAVGIAFGTYSSICVASPLLVTWHEWSMKRKVVIK